MLKSFLLSDTEEITEKKIRSCWKEMQRNSDLICHVYFSSPSWKICLQSNQIEFYQSIYSLCYVKDSEGFVVILLCPDVHFYIGNMHAIKSSLNIKYLKVFLSWNIKYKRFLKKKISFLRENKNKHFYYKQFPCLVMI